MVGDEERVVGVKEGLGRMLEDWLLVEVVQERERERELEVVVKLMVCTVKRVP